MTNTSPQRISLESLSLASWQTLRINPAFLSHNLTLGWWSKPAHSALELFHCFTRLCELRPQQILHAVSRYQPAFCLSQSSQQLLRTMLQRCVLYKCWCEVVRSTLLSETQVSDPPTTPHKEETLTCWPSVHLTAGHDPPLLQHEWTSCYL